jgi:hypothetical protein
MTQDRLIHRSSAAALHSPGATGLSRRALLKVGFGFSAVTTCAAILPGLAGCSSKDKLAVTGLKFLNAGDVALFTALIPVVVSDVAALPAAQKQQTITTVLKNIDAACSDLVVHQQGELRKLMDLLALGLLRRVLTGVGDWSEASPQDIEGFLARWRSSRFATFTAGVNALMKLTSVGYYVLPQAWPAAGYPGPLKYVFDAANS